MQLFLTEEQSKEIVITETIKCYEVWFITWRRCYSVDNVMS